MSEITLPDSKYDKQTDQLVLDRCYELRREIKHMESIIDGMKQELLGYQDQEKQIKEIRSKHEEARLRAAEQAQLATGSTPATADQGSEEDQVDAPTDSKTGETA